MVDEVIVPLVEVLQIFQLDALLVLTATLLDVPYQMGDRGTQVDHQLWRTDNGHHLVEELHEGFVVAVGEVAHGLVVLHKDVDAFVDGAVLDDGVVGFGNVYQVTKTLLQEVYFQIEGPTVDVAIIVFEIGVVVDSLKACLPPVVFG